MARARVHDPVVLQVGTTSVVVSDIAHPRREREIARSIEAALVREDFEVEERKARTVSFIARVV